MIGQIVYSRAGRDKKALLVTVGEKDGFVLVCNGKQRPLEKPKRKNRKHLVFTDSFVTEKQLSSNRSLRRALAQCRDTQNYEEEFECQNQI